MAAGRGQMRSPEETAGRGDDEEGEKFKELREEEERLGRKLPPACDQLLRIHSERPQSSRETGETQNLKAERTGPWIQTLRRVLHLSLQV